MQNIEVDFQYTMPLMSAPNSISIGSKVAFTTEDGKVVNLVVDYVHGDSLILKKDKLTVQGGSTSSKPRRSNRNSNSRTTRLRKVYFKPNEWIVQRQMIGLSNVTDTHLKLMFPHQERENYEIEEEIDQEFIESLNKEQNEAVQRIVEKRSRFWRQFRNNLVLP